jgi:hypothetical protein
MITVKSHGHEITYDDSHLNRREVPLLHDGFWTGESPDMHILYGLDMIHENGQVSSRTSPGDDAFTWLSLFENWKGLIVSASLRAVYAPYLSVGERAGL